MQAISLLDAQNSVPNEPEKSMAQMSEISANTAESEQAEQDDQASDSKLSSQEKLKAHYQDFSKEFQQDNADKCPMIGYNLHWIYQ